MFLLTTSLLISTPKAWGYLLGYLQAPEPRILPFHRYDGLDCCSYANDSLSTPQPCRAAHAARIAELRRQKPGGDVIGENVTSPQLRHALIPTRNIR